MRINKRKVNNVYDDVIEIVCDTKKQIIQNEQNNTIRTVNSTSMSSQFNVLNKALSESNNLVNSPENDKMIEKALDYCGICANTEDEDNQIDTEKNTVLTPDLLEEEQQNIPIDPRTVIVTDEDIIRSIHAILSSGNDCTKFDFTEYGELDTAFIADEETVLSKCEMNNVHKKFVNNNNTNTPDHVRIRNHPNTKPPRYLGTFKGHCDLPLWTDMYMKHV